MEAFSGVVSVYKDEVGPYALTLTDRLVTHHQELIKSIQNSEFDDDY